MACVSFLLAQIYKMAVTATPADQTAVRGKYWLAYDRSKVVDMLAGELNRPAGIRGTLAKLN